MNIDLQSHVLLFCFYLFQMGDKTGVLKLFTMDASARAAISGHVPVHTNNPSDLDGVTDVFL